MNRSNAVDFIKRQPVAGRGMANTDSKFMGALSTVRRRDGGAIVIVAEKPSPDSLYLAVDHRLPAVHSRGTDLQPGDLVHQSDPRKCCG
ncbi:MAG: hypothetical protein WAN44_13170 [Propionibacteriaceae bacterium]